MNFIINAGVSGDLKPFLQDKIKISNQVALLMAGVGLFYTIFSIVFYPSLTIYPLFCILLSFGAIVLNYFGLYNISRFMLSTLVILLAYLYHGFLVQPEEDIIPSMLFIEFALTVIPWILIDFREKSLLLISLLACYALLFSQTWANDVLSIELDSSLFRGGFLEIASNVFAVLILISCMVFMQTRNYTSEINNEKLVLDIHNKNGEMEKQRAELENHLKELNASRQLDKKQNWISQGITIISEILRLEEDGQIYNKLISAIVNYLSANQGGIYLLKGDKEEKEYLELISCYAYERHKFIDKRIEIGQGLIGQCFLEKETIILKDIPKEYIFITSGLGESVPTFIVIVPIKQENKIVGVLEFALFKDLEPYEIDFLNKLGESIASYVSANTLNAQTKKLLEQSQMQTEQLRAQEEEMRQNMEEMQATQEEMQRKEREYLVRIKKFENQPDKSELA